MAIRSSKKEILKEESFDSKTLLESGLLAAPHILHQAGTAQRRRDYE
jgi:hypothetical protein